MDKIKEIITLFEKCNINKMELETKEFKIKLEKDSNLPTKAASISNDIEVETIVENKIKGFELKSKLVGTYYQSNESNGEALVKIGSIVNQGDVVAVVEAMKVMNEIKSPVSGKVMKIYKNDGAAVGYDDILMEFDND